MRASRWSPFTTWLLLSLAQLVWADETVLELAQEYPVQGLTGGHLSGLSQCQGRWWAVSDRVDNQVFELILDNAQQQFLAQPYAIQVPPINRKPLANRLLQSVVSQVRGSELDFEGISCDSQHNLYLVSEAYSAVLQVNREGEGRWIRLPSNLHSMARANGLLLRHNAGLEGLALAEDGSQLWLAAERQGRGLIRLTQHQLQWRCIDNCVVLAEQHQVPLPAPYSGRTAADFSGLSMYRDKLFTLERAERQLCRRELKHGKVERCWSFASTESLPEKRYGGAQLGMAEALVIEEGAAWVGLDTADKVRTDQLKNPIIWQFKAPAKGWLH